MDGIWKTLSVALLAVVGTGVASSLWTSARLDAIRDCVQDVRERVIRIETKLEARNIFATQGAGTSAPFWAAGDEESSASSRAFFFKPNPSRGGGDNYTLTWREERR